MTTYSHVTFSELQAAEKQWTTALPLCCTLLHLQLWASCIFNRGNLHRPCVCRSTLSEWDYRGPYLHSPLKLQLVFWGHITTKPWNRRSPHDFFFLSHTVVWRKESERERHVLVAHSQVGFNSSLREFLHKSKIVLLLWKKISYGQSLHRDKPMVFFFCLL